MKRIATTLALATAGILLASDAWAFQTYNLVSGLLEAQGVMLAGTLRWFLTTGVPSFQSLYFLVIAGHLLHAAVTHWNLDTLAPVLIRKVLFFVLLWTFVFTGAPAGFTVYSFVEAQDITSSSEYQQGVSYAYDDQANTPAAVNAAVFTYADYIGGTLINTVNTAINGTDPGRRLPLILQRALTASNGVPMLKGQELSDAHQYAAECAHKYLTAPGIQGRSMTLMNSLVDQYDSKTDNTAILDALTTNVPNPDSSDSDNPNYTCLDLRNNLLSEVNDLVSNPQPYFNDVLTAYCWEDQNTNPAGCPSLDLNQNESILVANLIMTNELGMALDNRGLTEPPPQQQDAARYDPAQYQYGLMGHAVAWVQKTWRKYWTDNPAMGNAKVTSSLLAFYQRAPVIYGYCSVFFMLYAEVALIVSLVAGRLLFVYRAWLGMVVLKCLPVIWIFTDSIMRGALFVANPAVSQFMTYASSGSNQFQPDLFNQVMAHLNGIQDVTTDVMTYSFLILVPFLPGVRDIFAKSAG